MSAYSHRRVWVVNDFIVTVSALVHYQQVCMLTSCPYGQRLCWHPARMVNDFADILSIWSTTLLTSCPHNQQLCWHPAHMVNDFADILSAWSTTLLTSCPSSQRLLGHCVCIVNDYIGTCFRVVITFFAFISSRKRKVLWNRICLFIWGTGRVFFKLNKKVENLMTLSL